MIRRGVLQYALRSPLQHESSVSSSSNSLFQLRSFASCRFLALPGRDAHKFDGTKDINNEKEDEIAIARRWLLDFDAEKTIPRSICEVSFSRSSGPGGQNVNKVNSKATLRVPFPLLLPFVPPALHAAIRSSPYRTGRDNNSTGDSDALLIQASESRRQQDNVRACYAKLERILCEDAAKALPGATAEGAMAKVRNLQKADNERRLKAKKMQSNKKSSRKGGYD